MLQKRFYKQILDTPMGATFANYVLDDLLEHQLSRVSFGLPFFKKYADYIICAVPYNEIIQIQRIFNE